MEPYTSLFGSSDSLTRYYKLYEGRMYRLTAPYVRKAFRSMGYDMVNLSMYPDAHARLITASGQRQAVDYSLIGETTPSDFVASFPNGFYGTGITGSFVITDVIATTKGELSLKHANALFHQMLTKYVIPVQGGMLDLLTEYRKKRHSGDLSDMVASFILREFLSRSTGSFSRSRLEVLDDDVSMDMLSRLRYNMQVFEEVFVRSDVLCDQSFNRIVDARTYASFFDRFTSTDPGILRRLASCMRLDINPTI